MAATASVHTSHNLRENDTYARTFIISVFSDDFINFSTKYMKEVTTMSKVRVALLTAFLTACVFVCCTGLQLSAAGQKTESKAHIEGASFIGGFCNTIIKDECSWACMKDDDTVYQINITTDYTPYDLKEILLTDLPGKTYYLNASPFKDLCPVKTIYIKYLNKDSEVLVETELSRDKQDGSFDLSSYSVNVNYLDIYSSVLSGGK